jgi:hypothetical protein
MFPSRLLIYRARAKHSEHALFASAGRARDRPPHEGSAPFDRRIHKRSFQCLRPAQRRRSLHAPCDLPRHCRIESIRRIVSPIAPRPIRSAIDLRASRSAQREGLPEVGGRLYLQTDCILYTTNLVLFRFCK